MSMPTSARMCSGRARAAVGEQAEVAGLEGLALFLEAPVEGEHQELAEAVGVAVEGRLVDVGDGEPLVAELRGHFDAVAELLAQLLHVEVASSSVERPARMAAWASISKSTK